MHRKPKAKLWVLLAPIPFVVCRGSTLLGKIGLPPGGRWEPAPALVRIFLLDWKPNLRAPR
jgi:hypothetical protein